MDPEKAQQPGPGLSSGLGSASRTERLGPLLLAALSSGLLIALTWRRWTSPFIDVGRELYAPWRLSEGDVLYRDIAWFNGPLSAWWNSLCFEYLGRDLMALVAANAALLALALWMIVGLMRRLFDPLAAATSALVVPCVFALSQPLGIGNYNFLTPYSHELTHGLVLSLATLLAGERFRRGAGTWSLLAGALVGASFLTKPETFLAAAAAWITCFALALPRRGYGHALRALPLFTFGALLPLGLAWLRLRHDLPPDQARHALLGAWPYALDERVRSLPFYASMSGLLQPQAYAWAMLRSAGRYALYAGLWLGLLQVGQRMPQLAGLRRSTRLALLALAGLAAHQLFLRSMPWPSLARPLPLLVLATGLASTWYALRRPTCGQHAPRAALAALALALLAKVVLNVRLYHYGFALALPASLLAIGLSVHGAPRALAGRWPAQALRTLTVTFWLSLASLFVARTLHNTGERSATFGAGSDRLHAAPALGSPLQQALDDLGLRLQPGDTLLVMPEGVMLNYQLRAKSPTPHINFMPPELLFWGEDEILAALQASPATYVALVHKDTSEYGFPSFGRDYGRSLYAWVRASYRPLATYGAVPFTSSAFGVALYGPER